MSEIRERKDFGFETCWSCRHSRYDIVERCGMCVRSGEKIHGNLFMATCDDWER